MWGRARPFIGGPGHWGPGLRVYIQLSLVYTVEVVKRLVEIDDEFLEAARTELGTSTIKATVNEALRLAAGRRNDEVARALDVLAQSRLPDRKEAWR
jgi:Arc/MetJ family transcription regulator